MYRRAYRTSTPRMRVTEDNRSSDFSSRLLVRRSEIFSLLCATRNVAHGATHTFLDVSASLCRSSVRAWAASVVRYYGRMRTLTTHDLFNNTHGWYKLCICTDTPRRVVDRLYKTGGIKDTRRQVDPRRRRLLRNRSRDALPLARPSRCDDGRASPSLTRESGRTHEAPWLILPVVICLSQRLSHACLSACRIKVKPRMAH